MSIPGANPSIAELASGVHLVLVCSDSLVEGFCDGSSNALGSALKRLWDLADDGVAVVGGIRLCGFKSNKDNASEVVLCKSRTLGDEVGDCHVDVVGQLLHWCNQGDSIVGVQDTCGLDGIGTVDEVAVQRKVVTKDWQGQENVAIECSKVRVKLECVGIDGSQRAGDCGKVCGNEACESANDHRSE